MCQQSWDWDLDPGDSFFRKHIMDRPRIAALVSLALISFSKEAEAS